jgi:DNA-binding NtrC family response regulator
VIRTHLPPLRERGDDVVELTRHFVAELNRRHGREITGLSVAGITAVRRHRWPGNVRELANAIERGVLLSLDGELTPDDLSLFDVAPSLVAVPAPDGHHDEGGDIDEDLCLRDALLDLEKQLIERALERTGGNRTEAAALLGLNRTTLVEKLRRLGTDG